MKTFTNTFTNEAMSNQVTWVFNTLKPNGHLGDAIGDYVAVSSDKRRTYVIEPLCVKHDGERVVIIPNAEEEEVGFTSDMLKRTFVEHCEEVVNDGLCTVYFETVANAMKDLSRKIGLGWVIEESYDYETYEDCWHIYRKDFADKMYIGQDVYFAFTEECLVETMAEMPNAYCDFKKHEVIMMYPSREYDEDEAYVIFCNGIER